MSRSARAMVRRVAARVGIVGTTALAALVTAAVAPASATTEITGPDRYVALGDSYTAGPLIPVQSGQPAGCLRSTANYPSLVARSLQAGTFVDVSCSGATTTDLTAPQNVSLGPNPPQLDALTGAEDLVTLGIGGNDIGFAAIIGDCAARSPLAPFGSACKDYYTAGGTDQLAARIDGVSAKIADALDEIADRSPNARVALVGYPAILPDQGPGCFPIVPFSAGDVAYLRGVEKALNAMLEGEADDAGVTYVDTYTPTIGHDICQLPGRKWVEGLVPTAPAAPVHPNAQGMKAIAATVLADLTGRAAAA
ncbi:MAG TPA: SGNH/GDSL hydrolase family protein [Pseudonocardia sp.]|nr:SGNH/GDSL hydrolase family protein [Pseudonocardia sp.]